MLEREVITLSNIPLDETNPSFEISLDTRRLENEHALCSEARYVQKQVIKIQEVPRPLLRVRSRYTVHCVLRITKIAIISHFFTAPPAGRLAGYPVGPELRP